MNSLKLILVFFFLGTTIGFSQTEKATVIKPFKLDKSVLSGVGLDKIDIKDEPEKDFYQKNLYRGPDLSVYVVSTESWTNRMDNFPFDEFIYMFHGEALVSPDKGSAQLFQTGDYFFAPKGFTGEWEIKAGSNLHYELSVITTRRVDDSKIIADQAHILFDKTTLSGVDINLESENPFTQVLAKGAELTISLSSEKPGLRILDGPSKEKIIEVLSGQITLLDAEETEHIFYTGDYIVIPKGFTGLWKSEGHGLVKYLVVEKS